jgi:hypothetical protein
MLKRKKDAKMKTQQQQPHSLGDDDKISMQPLNLKKFSLTIMILGMKKTA